MKKTDPQSVDAPASSGKGIAAQLAAGMRRAMEPQVPEPTPTPRQMPPPNAAPPATQKGFACQSDQAPSASLDLPWNNLHPERIWPD
jgi:hypothetical protein